MFADRAKIIIKSGNGGNGHVSFRREKYVPNGGPDGGDGGKGGDIIFLVDEGMNTLSDYRYRRKFAAQNGEEGSKKNRHGRNGEDLILKVPEGTVLKDAESGKVIADMSGENTRQVILKGGRGGQGNQHYATAVMQAPKYAQPGKDGIEIEVLLELKVIADVGLVGFPNVGNFTTLSPNLGVVDLDGGSGFVIADIPGLIEGASEGVGLGHEFLRHIERTKVIVHVVDAASVEGRDPVADIYAINQELSAYNPDLLKKPQVIAANKIDAVYGEMNDVIEGLKAEFEKGGIQVFPISAVSGKGLKELLFYVSGQLVYEQEFDPALAVGRDGTFDVERLEDGSFSLEGSMIEKMLGYTNIDSEKGFLFFQRFLKERGILEELERQGIEDGDVVHMYGHQFDYYK